MSLSKSVFPASYEVPGGLIQYTLNYLNNTGNTLNKFEVIDVLPYIGDARTPPTTFTGSLTLSAIAGLPAGVSVEYTKAIPAGISSDPTHASNLLGGATQWCTSLSGGTCPANLAQVTAVRFVDTSGIPNGALRSISFGVQATATSANIQQIVTNASGGDSDQTALAVYSNHVNTKFVQSALSGRVYVDANANGVFDSGEAGIAGACIVVQGTATGGTDGPYSMLTNATGQYSFIASNGTLIFPSADCSGTAIGSSYAGLRSGVYSVTEQTPHPNFGTQTTLDSTPSANIGSTGKVHFRTPPRRG